MTRTIEEWATDAVKNLRSGPKSKDPVKRAYQLGLDAIIATDAKVYLGLTLAEIADEWCLSDPIELLAAIAAPDKAGLYTKGNPP